MAPGQIMLGMRPEDLEDANFISNPNPENLVQVQVDVVEPLGSEVYLYCVAGNQQFVARVDPRTQAKPGEPTTLHFNTNKMHAFNATTQETLL
jgi:multiple sugar transport system ATP-binding protein